MNTRFRSENQNHWRGIHHTLKCFQRRLNLHDIVWQCHFIRLQSVISTLADTTIQFLNIIWKSRFKFENREFNTKSFVSSTQCWSDFLNQCIQWCHRIFLRMVGSFYAASNLIWKSYNLIWKYRNDSENRSLSLEIVIIIFDYTQVSIHPLSGNFKYV